MKLTLTCSTMVALALAGTLMIIPPAYSRQVFKTAVMPVSDQTALVKKYCVGCHNDKKLVGGMSLEHFDPAHPDPTIAGLMVTKLQTGAMGAAGIQQPDKATLSALIDALA